MPKLYTTPKGQNLEWVRRLGNGQYGVANMVRTRRGEEFCLKEVSVALADEDDKIKVMNEVQLMKDASHVNVVTLHDSWFDRFRLYILMEYCPNGSLDMIIKQYRSCSKRFTEDKIVSFLKDIASALAYLHDTIRIIHRDLKPANIFVDQIGSLKLGDFGLSKSVSGVDYAATFVGTPLYMAPEQCAGETYSFAADVWAMGCISYELMALKSPWEGGVFSFPVLTKKIMNASPAWDHLLLTYSSSVIDSTQWMLQKCPTLRATSSQIYSMLSPQRYPTPRKANELMHQQKFIDDALKMVQQEAVRCIQKSFRASMLPESKKERSTSEPQPSPMPKPQLPPMPKPQPSPMPKPPLTPSVYNHKGFQAQEQARLEENLKASMAIQNAFRSSLHKKPRPQRRETRLDELAAPRMCRPQPKPVPRSRINVKPAAAYPAQRPLPRPAWL